MTHNHLMQNSVLIAKLMEENIEGLDNVSEEGRAGVVAALEQVARLTHEVAYRAGWDASVNRAARTGKRAVYFFLALQEDENTGRSPSN